MQLEVCVRLIIAVNNQHQHHDGRISKMQRKLPVTLSVIMVAKSVSQYVAMAVRNQHFK